MRATRWQVTEYVMDAFGDGDPNCGIWAITLQRKSPGRWSVNRFGDVLNDQGEWEYEPLPSSRDDDFKKRCRFPLAEAKRLGAEAFPRIIVNGMTADEARALIAEREATR